MARNLSVSRPLVGVLALGFLLTAGGLAVQIYWRETLQGNQWELFLAAFVRIGILLGAFWIALPSRKRPAAWENISIWKLCGILLAIVAVGVRPRIAVPLLIVLAIMWLILRPRQKKRPKSRAGER